MSDDLVKRLRLDWPPIFGACVGTMIDAANRIDELEAALQDMARYIWHGHWDRLKPQTRALFPGGKDG